MVSSRQKSIGRKKAIAMKSGQWRWLTGQCVDRVRRTDAVSEYLAGKGFPVRQRADRRLLQIKTPSTVVYAGAYTYLSGTTIPWEAYTMDHLKLLGKAMSDMHFLLADMPPAGLPSVYEEYDAVLQRMRRYFSDDKVTQAMYQKLGLRLQADVFARQKPASKRFIWILFGETFCSAARRRRLSA
jgi:Ser/Thr protein kinase RdoA (MazF antagonist)